MEIFRKLMADLKAVSLDQRQGTVKSQSIARIRRRTKTWLWSAGSFLVASSLLLQALPSPVLAATADYQASVTNVKVSLKPGEKKQITLKFKNTGNKTWYAGQNKTAVFLYGKSSLFGHASWLKDDLPALIAQSSVKPGQTASATFWIQAPQASGIFHDKYLLSYGPGAWVKNSIIDIQYTVTGETQAGVAIAPVTTVQTQVKTPAAPVAASNEWKAVLVDKGGIEWQMEPGQHIIVTLAFKNAGTATWTRDGKNYVSLYTGRDERTSLFRDYSWKSASQAVVLKEYQVKPGEIGHFMLELRAPEKAGIFQESFQLAAEDKAWISGGTVTLPIRVTASNAMMAKGLEDGLNFETGQPSQNSAYKAKLLLSSHKSLTLLGNGRISLTYGFKNTGSATWKTLSLRVTGVQAAMDAKYLTVRDESWVTGNIPAESEGLTAPGQIGFIGFTLKAPPKRGTYVASFKLYADGQPLDDGTIEIPVTVTADGYIEPDKPATTTPTQSAQTQTPAVSQPVNAVPLNGDASSLPNEPMIRVGLFATDDDQMMVRGVDGGFNLMQNGSTVCSLNAGEVLTVKYDRANKVYIASGPRCVAQSTVQYVAVQADGISPLELTDISRPVSWLPGTNDNKFRGKLELRYAPSTDLVWIINELPIEWYLKGIAETSNSSPQEYQRALLTAARTYAMYHVQRGTKHAAEFYTVDAKYDQVYRGYGAEVRNPNVVSAVDATRGQIVTYDGKLAITPYYSRSDGRTRSWTEVWGGGPYPWLVSVPVPWDQGKTLWGHGVGLSATGALGMAADGKTYDQILKYFYTGTELRKAYK